MAFGKNNDILKGKPGDILLIKSKEKLEEHLGVQINDDIVGTFFSEKKLTLKTSLSELNKLKAGFTNEKLAEFFNKKESLLSNTQDSTRGIKNKLVASIAEKSNLESAESKKAADEMLDLAINNPKDIGKKVEQKVEEVKNDALEKAKRAGQEVLEEQVPGLSKGFSFFDQISKAFSTAMKQVNSPTGGFIAAITAFLGILFGGKEVLENLETPEDSSEDGTSETTNITSTTTSKTPTEYVEVNSISKNSYHYQVGIKSIIHLAGNDLEIGDSTTPTLNKLGGKSISELQEIKRSGTYKGEKISVIDKKVISSILSDEATTLLETSMESSIVKQTLEKNTITLQKLLGDEYDEIIIQIEKKEFNYEKLSLETISVLSFFSINSFGLLTLEGVKEMFQDGLNFLGKSDLDMMETISQDIKEKESGIVSTNIIKAFTSSYGGTHFGGPTYMSKDKDNEVLETMNSQLDIIAKDNGIDINVIQENKEEVEKIIDFKNWLLSSEFIGDKSKTLLDKTGKSKYFTNSLDYMGVVALYIILGGNKNLDNITTFDYPVMYKTISFIIGRDGEKGHASGYLAEVIEYFSTSNNDIEIFEDSNEKESVQILSERLTKDWLKIVYSEIKEKLGWVGLMEDNAINDALGIFTGLVASKGGSAAMKKGAIMKGSALKKFGILAVISSIGSLIHTSYGKSSDFINDLGSFGKNSSYKEKTNTELELIAQKAEDLNSKFQTVEVNGQKVGIYSGKNGLEVFYKKGIYKLGLLNTGFETTKDGAAGVVKSAINFFSFEKGAVIGDNLPNDVKEWLDSFVESGNKKIDSFINEEAVNGKHYDLSKSYLDDTTIHIGEQNTLKISVENIVKALNGNPQYPKKFWNKNENNTNDPSFIILEGAVNTLTLRRVEKIK